MVADFDMKSDFLSDCAKQLMDRYPKNQNFRFVADKIGISPSSFQRILKKEVKNPNFHLALKIVRALCPDGEVKKFVEKFYPEMIEDFVTVYPDNSDVPFVEPEVEDFFKRNETYLVMVMALNTPKLTRQKIGLELGRRGLVVLDQLVQRNIIKQKGEYLHIRGPVNLGQPGILALFKNFVNNHYDIDNFGMKDNWMSVNTLAVNADKAMPVLKEICEQANKKIWETLNQSEYKGEDIVWTGIVMDNLHPKREDFKSIDDNSGDLIQ